MNGGIPVIGAYYFLSGAVLMGNLVVALFFYRYWAKSRDRLFLFFSVAFVIFGLERVVIALAGDPNSERTAALYLIRFMGFVLILAAIVDKNRAKERA